MSSSGPKEQARLKTQQVIGAALGRIPLGTYVLTAHHEDRRGGMLVGFVQQVCVSPPMVSVAVEKGRPIMPLISESRRFGLCQLSGEDRLVRRKFAFEGDLGEDPFLGFDLIEGELTGLPILVDAMSYLECSLTCHMDVEGDHDLFVGQVLGAGSRRGEGGAPDVRFRENGLRLPGRVT